MCQQEYIKVDSDEQILQWNTFELKLPTSYYQLKTERREKREGETCTFNDIQY